MVHSVLERSEVTPDASRKFKFVPETFPSGTCPACTGDEINAAIELVTHNKFITDTLVRNTTCWEQGTACMKFAGMCYANLGRKAIMKSQDHFCRHAALLDHADYRTRVHLCGICRDHFHGEDMHVDHKDPEFRVILLAFLHLKVPGWLERPDDATFKKVETYGWRSRVSKAQKMDHVETPAAYWQRVKNTAVLRWAKEGLGPAFAAFHNACAVLQMACSSCHSQKSERYLGHSDPVFIPALGLSPKQLHDQGVAQEQLQKEKDIMQNEQALFNDAGHHVKALWDAIRSIDVVQMSTALDAVPPLLKQIPLVISARSLLKELTHLQTAPVLDLKGSVPESEPHIYHVYNPMTAAAAARRAEIERYMDCVVAEESSS